MPVIPLGEKAIEALDRLFAELMGLPDDYVGPLETNVRGALGSYHAGPDRHNELHLIIEHLANLAEGATNYAQTVRRANSDLTERGNAQVVFALCPKQNAYVSPYGCTGNVSDPKKNRNGYLTDYLTGMRLFTLDRPEVLAAASAQMVRNRREEEASYRRCTTRYIWAAEDAMTQWVSSQNPTPTEAQKLGRAERLEVLINAALPNAKGAAQMDAPKLLARHGAADTPYGKLLYATMLAQLLGVPLD